MVATLEEIGRDPRLRGLIRPSPYWPWDIWEKRRKPGIEPGPTPKQVAFLMLNAIPEGLFGGAVGGGKSDALLLAALQYVDLSDYDAILFRRTFPELNAPGGLIDRSHDWLGPTDAVYNQTDHRWVFPTGATVSFGHMQYENDKYLYQSAEFSYAAFDEGTLFTESQYTYISSTRMRKVESSPFPIRVRVASNPVGIGREWARRRFIIEGPKMGRFFIPSTLDDNPYLDTGYEARLGGLTSVEYQQLRWGDWDVEPEGTKFKRYWFQVQDRSVLPQTGLKWVRYWDTAATDEPKKGAAKKSGDPDYTVGLLMARHGTSGTYYVVDVERFRASQGAAEDHMAAVARRDGRSIPIREEQEPGASGKKVIAYHRKGIFDGYDYAGVVSTGDKEVRANPVAGRAEHGDVVLISGEYVTEFLSEVGGFPQGAHDDQVDAFSGAFNWLSGKMVKGAAPGGGKRRSGWRPSSG